MVEVTAQAVGIGVVQVCAESAAFNKAAVFIAEVRRNTALLARALLTAAEPLAAPVFALSDGDQEPVTLTIIACQNATSQSPRCVIHATPVSGNTVMISESLLEVLAPDYVAITLDPTWTTRIAFAAVTLHDPSGRKRTFSLEPGTEVVWPCWRASRFEPVSYEFQLQYVERFPDGTTAPLVTGPWQPGEGTHLLVTPISEALSLPV
jgi:hypothetical protein